MDKHAYSDIIEAQQKYWQCYVDDSLSFIVKDKNGRMVAVSLNDAFDFNSFEICRSSNSRSYNVAAVAGALTHFLKKQIM